MATVQKLIGALACQFGICPFALDTLEKFTAGKSLNERMVLIGHDETTAQADVKFNCETKCFDGLLNMDYTDEKQNEWTVIAYHFTVFKVRFVLSKFEVTICTISSKRAVKGTEASNYTLVRVWIVVDVFLGC